MSGACHGIDEEGYYGSNFSSYRSQWAAIFPRIQIISFADQLCLSYYFYSALFSVCSIDAILRRRQKEFQAGKFDQILTKF